MIALTSFKIINSDKEPNIFSSQNQTSMPFFTGTSGTISGVCL